MQRGRTGNRGNCWRDWKLAWGEGFLGGSEHAAWTYMEIAW